MEATALHRIKKNKIKKVSTNFRRSSKTIVEKKKIVTDFKESLMEVKEFFSGKRELQTLDSFLLELKES